MSKLNYLRLAEVKEAVRGEERFNEKTINIGAKPSPDGLQALALRNVLFEDMFYCAQKTQSRGAGGKLPIGRCQNKTTDAGHKVKTERSIVVSGAILVELLLLQN